MDTEEDMAVDTVGDMAVDGEEDMAVDTEEDSVVSSPQVNDTLRLAQDAVLLSGYRPWGGGYGGGFNPYYG